MAVAMMKFWAAKSGHGQILCWANIVPEILLSPKNRQVKDVKTDKTKARKTLVFRA
ncbi:hypothetical protein [Paramagnetospirillum magnetotacticum]|uniref:hypothetical protein n=1 Tax=Paramagnetospirillum magnetotacticum TaxID=188 RepID=UPI001364B677|nr:hypothetical protein [Paramagnetospirillum magnetotacticum]